jgi:ppGpp synthetase/RelA/SpoT-type nucleotidyltranferase
MSKNQVRKLGKRLADASGVAGDEASFELILASYYGALDEVESRIATLEGLPEAVTRIKTRDTLLAKIRREPGMALSSMQDIAGARLVVAESTISPRDLQDQVVAALVAEFEPCEVKDRRIFPSHGYRAVHVIVTADGLPVEIQVRTPLQDKWAQLMEKLADSWGRGIRYGEEPETPDRREAWALMLQLSEGMADYEEAIQEQDAAIREGQQLIAMPPELRDEALASAFLEQLQVIKSRADTSLASLQARVDALQAALTVVVEEDE